MDFIAHTLHELQSNIHYFSKVNGSSKKHSYITNQILFKYTKVFESTSVHHNCQQTYDILCKIHHLSDLTSEILCHLRKQSTDSDFNEISVFQGGENLHYGVLGCGNM